MLRAKGHHIAPMVHLADCNASQHKRCDQCIYSGTGKIAPLEQNVWNARTRRKLCDSSPPYQMMSTPHRTGHHCRSAVPCVLAVEKGGARRASRESLTCIQLAWLARATREGIARVLWQKIDMPFVIDIVQLRSVRHERRPTTTDLEVGEVQNAVDGFWLCVNAWHQNDVVATDCKHARSCHAIYRCGQVNRLIKGSTVLMWLVTH